MGLALAQAAVERGWPTTLLLGPTNLQPTHDSHLTVQRFQTTAELERLLHEKWPEHDVLIMAAAVADYRPSKPLTDKLSRGRKNLTLTLEPTPDLLAGLAGHTRPDQLVIGFALEPADRLSEAARAKLKRKHLDAIIANPLDTMDSEEIDATLFLADGTHERVESIMRKSAFASWLLDRLAALKRQRASA